MRRVRAGGLEVLGEHGGLRRHHRHQTAGAEEQVTPRCGGGEDTFQALELLTFRYIYSWSAEVEPPGLGSKCGKRVERLSDF